MEQILRCPACGAPDQSLEAADGQHTCQHCGVRYRLRQGAGGVVRAELVQASKARFVALAAVLFTVLVGGVVVVLLAGSDEPEPDAGPPVAHAPAIVTELAPATASLDAPEELGPPTADLVVHGTKGASGDSFYVLAEVSNSSPYVIDKPKLLVVLYDQDGEEIFQDDGYASLDRLAPGQTSPAKVLVSEPPPYAHFEVELALRRSTYSPPSAAGLRVETLPATEDGRGHFRVSGKVHNEGDQAARFVAVIAVARDEHGAIVGIDNTYAGASERLEPGASARFLLGTLMYDQRPSSWDFLVTGRVAD